MARITEKTYSFIHTITETKLLALISAHADEVQINIYNPATQPPKPKAQLKKAAPLLLAGPDQAPPAPSKMTGAAMVLLYMAQHKDRVIPMLEMSAYIKQHRPDLTASAATVGMSYFLKKGFVERIGKGQYKILAAGVATATEWAAKGKPSSAQSAADPPASKPKRGDARILVWAELVKDQPVATKGLRTSFKEIGFTASAALSAMDAFVKNGWAKRTGKGVYHITAKGLKHHAAESKSS